MSPNFIGPLPQGRILGCLAAQPGCVALLWERSFQRTLRLLPVPWQAVGIQGHIALNHHFHRCTRLKPDIGASG